MSAIPGMGLCLVCLTIGAADLIDMLIILY